MRKALFMVVLLAVGFTLWCVAMALCDYPIVVDGDTITVTMESGDFLVMDTYAKRPCLEVTRKYNHKVRVVFKECFFRDVSTIVIHLPERLPYNN